MKITRNTWIFVGIFFWGIPIAVIFSLITTLFIPPDGNTTEQIFQWNIFLKNFELWGPIFIFHGVIFGLVMDYFSRKYHP